MDFAMASIMDCAVARRAHAQKAADCASCGRAVAAIAPARFRMVCDVQLSHRRTIA
jgi:ribosomal protein L34E